MMRPRLLLVVFFLLLTAAHEARAQGGFEPIPLVSGQTEIHLWTSGNITYARVTLSFPDLGHRVVDWGQPTRNGNDFSVDIKAEKYTEGSGQMILVLNHVYELGALPAGNYSFNVFSRGAPVKSQQFDPSLIIEHWEPLVLNSGQVLIAIRTTGGATFAFITLFLSEQPHRIVDWGRVTRNGNEFTVDVKVEQWTGAAATRRQEQQAYSLGPTPPGSYSFVVKSYNQTVKTQAFTVTQGHPSSFLNAIEDPHFFVRQQYLDFLGREPEPGGLTYWANQLIQCGADVSCLHSRRIGVSAAFFMEPEDQERGNFIYRLYVGTLNRRPSFAEFKADRLSLVSSGDNLEANKAAFLNEWVTRAEFLRRWPETLSPEDFVKALYDAAGLHGFNYAEEQQALSDLKSNSKSRAAVIRDMIELQHFREMQYNPAFVLMQYFGYLQRDPEQAGLDFWLNVLNNKEPGNFRGMVCSFITSAEYQNRFGSTLTRSNRDCAQP